MIFQNFSAPHFSFSTFLFLALSLFYDVSAVTRALHTAASGMAAQEENVNAISNNIANVNTTAYKKTRVEFEDLFYQTIKEAGARSQNEGRYSVGVQLGNGAKVSASRKYMSVAGSPQITNRPFDFMVSGEGFFAVSLPNGQIEYTRDGSFNVNAEGILVNGPGYSIFPGLVMPPGTVSVNVSEDGNVDAYSQGQTEPTRVGQIPIFTFINPVGLKAAGKNLYRATASSGPPQQSIAGNNGAGAILQGTLESSNVSIMIEMTDLIKAQRAYETNSKVMSTADSMLQTVNNLR